MPSIKLKWNKSTFDDVAVDESVTTVEDFKRIVNYLTGVPLDRQKLMCKGGWTGTLKDDADFRKIPWTEGMTVTMMGSADVIVQTDKYVFIEDMTDVEKAASGVLKTSAGLTNLGNTCYMNSTIQCLRHIDSLRTALSSGILVSSAINPAAGRIVSSLDSTFRVLDQSASAVTPARFVLDARSVFPQFAERSSQGHYMQQDAEEFYNVISQTIGQNFQGHPALYDEILGLELQEQLTCAETDLEQKITRSEKISKVVCSIQGGLGSTVNIDHMHEGIKLWLEGTMEKHSDVLQRDALWKRSARISKLPKYLCVQFLRFFWKPTPENPDRAGVKCKILRAVSFPETLDVYQFCSEEIQNELKVNRESQDKEIEEAVKATEEGSTSAAAASESANAPMETDDEEERALQAALALSMGQGPDAMDTSSTSSKVTLISHLPPKFTGMYELHSLVTHKGRSADSGHYIGWARQAPGSDLWWKYDDDKVTETTTEEVLKLKGGGDREMAYLVFYRAKA